MSDTPETDMEHAKFAMGGFTLDFCRKLERERDEARLELEDWENAAKHVESDHPNEVHCSCVPVYKKLLNDARLERDEAITRRLETIMQCELYEQELEEARRQCSQWLQEWHLTDKVRRDTKAERDEARKQRNCLHQLHNKNAIRSKELLELCETLRKERDEAIKAFKELWQMSETLLPEISEEQSDKWHKVIFTK